MKLYDQVIEGVFLERPNRFIAHVQTENGIEICHVKNTGRCRELLVPGCKVYLSVAAGGQRKTRCDLVAVQKGDRLINMDSQAPNRAAAEAIPELFPKPAFIRPEMRLGESRMDFYIETREKKIYMEVKGVTLEEGGAALFPDAPTQRGVRHLQELEKWQGPGREAVLLFVIQMKDVHSFMPNHRTHPEFADALFHAWKAGVRLLAYDCLVTPTQMKLNSAVNIVWPDR